MEEEYLLSSLGYEGLSFIEIERGGGRRCDLCVVRWSAAGVVWMRKNIRLQISGVEKSCMLKEYFFMMKDWGPGKRRSLQWRSLNRVIR